MFACYAEPLCYSALLTEDKRTRFLLTSTFLGAKLQSASQETGITVDGRKTWVIGPYW